jgi:hypothetical protein
MYHAGNKDSIPNEKLCILGLKFRRYMEGKVRNLKKNSRKIFGLMKQ